MGIVSRAFTLAVCLWTLGLSAETASSQVIHGTILGTVTDETRGSLAGVTIVIQNVDTGATRELVTDSSGRYRAPGLPLGNYEVRVQLTGFQGQRQDGIELTVGSEVVVNFRLALAQVEETITVQGAAPQVDLTGSTIANLVDEAKIQDLPLNGRDYAELILLQPGVVLSRASVDSANTGRGIKISVAGARPNQNLYTLDGTDFNDALNNTPASAQGLMTGVETVQEFQVLTNTFSAEYGRATGGVFNVVTKSGTNDFHGSAFEFYRGDSLDSKNYFDDEKPEFWRHQFGFSLGGPILQDRTFFFASYEGLREFKGVTQVASVPDALARQGILPDGPVDIDPNVLPLLELYPLPTGGPILDEDGNPTGIAEFKGILDRDSDQDFATVRVDHTFSPNDSMFVRYLYDDSVVDQPLNLPDWPNIVTNEKHILTVEQQHLFSDSSMNEFRFGFNRTNPTEDVNPVDPHEEIAFVPGESFGEIQVTGLTEVGTDRTNPKLFFQDLYQFTDNVSVWKGSHALKMGVNFRHFKNDGDSQSRTRGRLRFRGLEEFLTGSTRTFEIAKPGSDFARRYRQNLIGVFFQDDWSVSDRLVLNLGLRYEYATIPTEVDGKVSNLRSIEDAEVTVGDPYFNNPTELNFAPRAGFSWDVFGNGRTAIRGGVGLFHEAPLFFQWRNPIFRTLPFVDRAVVSKPDLPIDIGQAEVSGPSETEAFEFDPVSARFWQYNVNLQQQLGQDLVVSVGYVGSRGDNLFGQGDLNIAIPEIRADGTEFFPNDDRRNPNFDTVDTIIQGFRSRYNALHLGVNRRLRQGFQFQASYTLGKVMDNRSGSGGRQEGSNGQARTFDPYDFEKDWSRSDFDIRHNFVFNITYELPLGEGRLAEGWIVSGIGTFATGVPFSPLIEGDPDGDGSDSNAARPDVVPGVSTEPDGGRTADQWFNPAAFSFPEPGTRGNAGRNSLDGPGLRMFDLAFMKTTDIGGGMQLQIRVEVFNLFNRANFALPANDPDGSVLMDDEGEPLADVGKIFSTTTDAREAQIGIKLLF